MNILEYRRRALGYTYRADGDYDYSTPSANEAIRQMYIQNVGREPDAGGLAYFADRFGTDVSAKELAAFREMASAEVAAVEAQRAAAAPAASSSGVFSSLPAALTNAFAAGEGQGIFTSAAPTPAPTPAPAPVPTPAPTPAPAAPAAPVTGTHRELRENQEGTYYVEVPNTQAYIDSENQKAAAAAVLATQRQADATLQNKSLAVAAKFGGTPIYTGGDVAARLYQGDEVEAASYSPLAIAGYFAPTERKGYSHTYDAQGNYTGIVNTSPSGFINQISDTLAQLDSDLGLSKNAPLIVAIAINVLAPGAGAAIGQSLVSSGLVTSASAASAAALAGGATAAGAAAAGAAASAFATTVGTAILNTGVQLASGVPVEKALTNAVLSVAGASFTPGISSVVKEVVGNATATNIITNAVVSAGKAVVTGDNIGDAFVGSLASGVANAGADKIISGLSINELPTEAVGVIKAGIVGTILTGDGTTAMTNAAINAGVTAVIDGASNGIISLSNDAIDSLNNIVTTTDATDATANVDAINLQTATNAGFSDFATYMQYGGDLQAYNAAQSGTTNDGAGSVITTTGGTPVINTDVDDLVEEINSGSTTASSTTPVGGLSVLSDTPLAETVETTGGSTITTGGDAVVTGDDAIVGGLTTASTIDGGAGNDTVDTTPIVGGLTAVSTVTGGAGNDTVDTTPIIGGLTTASTVTGGAGNDVVSAEDDAVVDGLTTVDTVTGGAGNDVASTEAATTGALTQVQQNLADDANAAVVDADVVDADVVSAEAPSTGGLTQVQQNLINAVNEDSANTVVVDNTEEAPVATINTVASDSPVAAVTPVAEATAFGEDDTVASKGPVTGGLTQAQQNLIEDKENNVNVTAPVVGGLNQVALTDSDTAATTGTTGAKVAGSNTFGNILKKIISKTASGAARNIMSKAAGQKTAAKPVVAKKATGPALTAAKTAAVPKKLDISKLTPVAKRTVPLKKDVSKLTPVSKIAGLTSLIKGKG